MLLINSVNFIRTHHNVWIQYVFVKAHSLQVNKKCYDFMTFFLYSYYIQMDKKYVVMLKMNKTLKQVAIFAS